MTRRLKKEWSMTAKLGLSARPVAVWPFTEVLDGRNTAVKDGIGLALGRPARDFSDYVRETAKTGAWSGSQQS
jgi:hypothetical protein